MRIGIPREIHEGERRVAVGPEVCEKLKKMGFEVSVESQAGAAAQFSDEAYREAGADVVEDVRNLWSSADLILKVRAPQQNGSLGLHEVDLMKETGWLVSFIWPAQNPELMDRFKSKKATVLAMDCVPRISRAQKLDALSSMANIAGYRAVIEAAHHFGRFFTGQVTAAGKIPPAKVFVIGAGVAGLSVIGTASSLGAIVRATDTRSEVKDQIKSMGGEFVEVQYQEEGSGGGGYAKVMSEGFQKAQREMIFRQCMEVDIVITTALIPGKPAPKLITTAMVESMKAGSVIVDLASEQGGNCEVTVPGKVITHNGVTVIGYADLPSRLPTQSSQLFANNLLRLIEELCPKKDGTLNLNMQDDMLRGTTVMENGTITWPPPPIAISATSKVAVAAPPVEVKPAVVVAPPSILSRLGMPFGLGALAFLLVGGFAPTAFLGHFTVFVLSCFIGYMVVWNVTPALHTPLMSVTNAVSSIIIVGALIQGSSQSQLTVWLAVVAILLTTINMAGGFWVTHRMLKMFRR
jgi:NAD(P) transhydrogenase subunit alpha